MDLWLDVIKWINSFFCFFLPASVATSWSKWAVLGESVMRKQSCYLNAKKITMLSYHCSLLVVYTSQTSSCCGSSWEIRVELAKEWLINKLCWIAIWKLGEAKRGENSILLIHLQKNNIFQTYKTRCGEFPFPACLS